MRPLFPIVRLIFQRSCDDYQYLIFVFFCHLLRLMGIYRVGAPSEYLKSFVPYFLVFLFFSFLFFSFLFSFLFFFFFSFLHFLFCLFLEGPFSSRAPGHCPPMPPSRYATGEMDNNELNPYSTCSSCWDSICEPLTSEASP